MSVRLSLLALATLALGACDGDPLGTPAQPRQVACCCDRCPAGAAPATASPAVTSSASGERAVASRAVYRVRSAPRVRRESRYDSYESSGAGQYGGRYGARGGSYGRVSFSVEETSTSTERYSSSESSSGYAGGGAYGYGPRGPRDGRVSRDPPHHRGYRLAGFDEDGYLTWPGKIED
jgi:hypothetical protein